MPVRVPKDGFSWESATKPNGEKFGDSYRPGAEPKINHDKNPYETTIL